ncbi:MAG: hypothetical protein NC217_08280 [Muribaculaceae bacterium]|nr:hypothetical protein [Muribaculaceae bacterium]
MCKKVLAALLVLCCCSMAHGAPRGSITATLDSTVMLMGNVTRLNIKVEKPSDVKGHFPLFNDNTSAPYVTLLNDTVELSKAFTSDTTSLPQGLQRVIYHIPVQVFDSGEYKIPGLKYVMGSDTLTSNQVDLKIVPVKNVTKDDPISDYTDVVDPEGGSWLDKVPESLIVYWWAYLLGLIILIAIVLLIIYWYKHRARKSKNLKPELPPYEEAVRSLNILKDKQLWQHGKNELYFVELTDILRRYLSRRFDISAPEMTTTQFLDEASRNPKLASHNAELKRLLELADFIKFAKGQSLPAENEEAFNIVRRFADETRPTKEELEAQKREMQQEQEAAPKQSKKLSVKSSGKNSGANKQRQSGRKEGRR